ncbi:MAG TPA: hypothetical protein VKT29_14555 [Terriglobales bacterium]|nr:hypothetical protein [Terriglobales bacterium]
MNSATVQSEAVSRSETGRSWAFPLGLTLALRLLYSALAAVFAFFLPWDPRLVSSNFAENVMRPDGTLRYALLGVWQRFDTVWYLHIAAHGYDRPDAVVFYPLYPWLVKVLGFALSPTLAALAISTVATFIFFWALKNLLELDFRKSTVRTALLLYAVCPGSFILLAGYPDSLALALIVLSVYLARIDHWWQASFAGMAAAVTKAIGGLAFIPLFVLAWRGKKPRAWSVVLVPATGAAYQLWLRWSGHPSLSSAYAHYWKTETVWPWITLRDAAHAIAASADPYLILNLATLAFVTALVARAPRRLEYLLYSIALLLLFLTKHSVPLLQSTVRYVLAIFPAFLGLALLLECPWLKSRLGMLLAALLILNLTGLYLFLKWSLVF